jgi:hypothetical protein
VQFRLPSIHFFAQEMNSLIHVQVSKKRQTKSN